MQEMLLATKKVFVLTTLFTIVVAGAACSIFKYPRNGIYLVPKGYIGDVIIVFDQVDGVELETENGLFVYQIPDDGVLRVRNKGYSGIVNLHYFYIDKNGDREKIDFLRITGDRDPQGLPQNKFGNISTNDFENRVYIMNAGGLGSFNTKKGVVQFSRFIVATPMHSERDHLYGKMEDRTFDIQRELTHRAATEQP